MDILDWFGNDWVSLDRFGYGWMFLDGWLRIMFA